MFEDLKCQHGVRFLYPCKDCAAEALDRRTCWSKYMGKSPFWCTVPLDSTVCKEVRREKFEEYTSSCVGCVYHNGESR